MIWDTAKQRQDEIEQARMQAEEEHDQEMRERIAKSFAETFPGVPVLKAELDRNVTGHRMYYETIWFDYKGIRLRAVWVSAWCDDCGSQLMMHWIISRDKLPWSRSHEVFGICPSNVHHTFSRSQQPDMLARLYEACVVVTGRR